MYITSRFQIAIDVKTVITRHVFNNKYDQLLFFTLKLLFESELYITFQVIYIDIVFWLNFVSSL